MSDGDEAGAGDVDTSDDLDHGARGSEEYGDAAEDDDADDSSDVDESEESDEFEDIDDLIAEFEEPSGDLEDLFTEVETSDFDAEAVWDALDGDGRRPTRFGGASAPLEEPAPADEAVVNKASYCQRCEHFSGPPAMRCTNPGTDIVELVDVRHVRVRNCPVVERRRSPTVARLEEEDDGDDPSGGAASTATEGSRRTDAGE